MTRRAPSPLRRVSTPARLLPPIDERPVSDMAHEMLLRALAGLHRALLFGDRDEQVLYHYLFGRSCERIGAGLGLRESTVHRILHRVFARTRTKTRRELLHCGLRLHAERELAAPRQHARAA